MVRFFLGLVFLLVFKITYAQKEDFVWRFGYNAGINFNTGTADTFSLNKVTAIELTNSSICDKNGNLLFYSNGNTLFNLNSDTMFNGKGLNPSHFTSVYYNTPLGGLPIYGADIIIQRPNHLEQYYLFHQTIDNDTTFPYWYSNILYLTVIDMTLDSGQGGVTSIKNYHLYDNDTLLAGGLAAVRHGNGRDWWLVAKKLYLPYFYKWLITPDTIQGPFIQTDQPGSQYIDDVNFTQACFSLQGDKYAVMYPTHSSFYLYDFDRCSGLLSYVYSTSLGSTPYGISCAFSPSGRYVYVGRTDTVYQFDVANIATSKTVIGGHVSLCSPPTTTTFGCMRLAPDGKIYISTTGGCYQQDEYLSVIEYPDSVGLSCNLIQQFIKSPSSNAMSLPNLPDYKLGALHGTDCDSLTSVPELRKDNLFNIKIYPNPVLNKATLFVKGGIKEQTIASIYDEVGRLVFSVQVKDEQTEIDLTHFSRGIYTVHVVMHQNITLLKFALFRLL